MFLCDMFCFELVVDDVECIEKIFEFYVEDVIWEGVGFYYEGQFGQVVGKEVICKYFQVFWGQKKDLELFLNVYYLILEQIYVNVDCMYVDGQWVYCQLWIFGDGLLLLCFSWFNNLFKKVDGVWKIVCICIENVFVVLLVFGWVNNVLIYLVLMK